MPHFFVKDIRALPFAALKQAGVSGVVFDKDNTLTAPFATSIFPTLSDAVNECRDVFGDRVALFSNSAGSPDDVGYQHAERLERQLGISVIRHQEKKPEARQDVLRHFQCSSGDRLLAVGDRYFTDVLFGNLCGMLTVATQILTEENDPLVVRPIRRLEERYVRGLLQQGIKPPSHPLYEVCAQLIERDR